MKAFWLLKSEPDEYSIYDMERQKITKWSGVRNHQAQRNLRNMKLEDMALFYHTGKNRGIVGVVTVAKEFYLYDNMPVVDIAYHTTFNQIIPLSVIKNDIKLQNMQIIKQARLSVSEVTYTEWQDIMKIQGD